MKIRLYKTFLRFNHLRKTSTIAEEGPLASSSVRYSLNKNKYLLAPELDRLKRIISDYELSDARNCFMIGVALRTGARAQEVLNLTIADLNTYDETVYIRGLKNSNDREIPLQSDYFKRLYRFAESQVKAYEADIAQDLHGPAAAKPLKKGEHRLFPITYDRLYQVWAFYRPIPKKFHSLRHTFAIELYQKTKDLRLVQVQQELKKLIL
ncbi:MAG: site-specific integrase [Proteobacteria bacterium]|nr:MAG: site-specific integrase [Pseudomonadota bacterium]